MSSKIYFNFSRSCVKYKHQPQIKHILLLIFIHLLLCSALRAQIPVNPNASAKTKEVLNYIYKSKNYGFITGQHNYSRTYQDDHEVGIEANNAVENTTEQSPGLWGSDFSFTDSKFSIQQLQENRQKMINVAIDQWNKGSLITLTYHMVNPKYEENGKPADLGWPKVREPLSEKEYLDVVTMGTDLNKNFLRNLDRIIPFLKQLEDKNIPVLWRPFHEMNGIFWWGSDNSSKLYFRDLWKLTYDYMVKTKGLNNLIWVWAPNHWSSAGFEDPSEYKFPGIDYVDILGVDDYFWTQDGFLNINDYKTLVRLAQGKPLAITEGFNPEILIPYPKWIAENRPEYRWFMLWDDNWIYNRALDKPAPLGLKSNLINVYNDPRSINQGMIPVTGSIKTDTIPPSAPQRLSYKSRTDHTVTLTWKPSKDHSSLTSYNVYENGKKINTGKITGTTYTARGLKASTNYIFTVIAKDESRNLSPSSQPLKITTLTEVPAQKYEAEAAEVVGPIIQTAARGQSGTGFVDFKNSDNDFVQWKVNISKSGTYILDFIYSHGGIDKRPMELVINDKIVNQALVFTPTGGWEQWISKLVTTKLKAGENIIRIRAIGASGPNYDYLNLKRLVSSK